MGSSLIIPFHPQDEITIDILLEPLIQEPIPVPFEASRSKSLITKQSLCDFLKKNKKAEQPELQPVASITMDEVGKNTYEKVLVDLFDPVPVESLEKMFPANNKWKQWADKAKATGLICARKARAKFNPYQAGMWFIRKGMEGWDEARLYRTLANNLPARSRDSKHLLTEDID